MMQASTKALLLLLLPFFLAQVQLVSSQDSTLAKDQLWSDEFDTNGAPDPSVWSYDLGGGGWGNGEAQVYTSDPSNINVTDGNLLITVNKNEVTGEFTSARIKTQDNVLFKYGTVQARIMLPNVADGLWPAFWTLGETYPEVDWPATGEIDIMEVGQGLAITKGLVNNRVVSAAHWQYNGTYATYPGWFDSPEPLNGTYHFYQMDWTPTLITTYVDNNKIWEIDISPEACVDCEEFHQPHFMLLNIAVGGGFTNVGGRRRKLKASSTSSGCDGSSSSAGGASSSSSSGGCSPRLPEEVTAPIPATMAVDYLRIFDNGFTEVIAPIPGVNPTASPVGQIIAATAPQSASPTAVPTASPVGQIIAATAPPSASSVASAPTAVPTANNARVGATKMPVADSFRRPTSSPSLHKGTPAPTFSATGRGTSPSGKSGKGGKGGKSGKSGKGSSKAKSSKAKSSKGGKAGKGGKASKGNDDVSSVTANLNFTSAAARSNMAPAAVLTVLATTALYMAGAMQL
jgi:beta-glucanase (GH16 family)